MPAGPSEALVLADRSARPSVRRSRSPGPGRTRLRIHPVVLVVTDDTTWPTRCWPKSSGCWRRWNGAGIIEPALADHGLVVVAPDRDAAIRFADDFAAEHLSIHLDGRRPMRPRRITGAGSVFVGPVGSRTGGRLRQRRQPRAAHRGPGRLDGAALHRGLRIVAAGADVDPRRPGRAAARRWPPWRSAEGLTAHLGPQSRFDSRRAA